MMPFVSAISSEGLGAIRYPDGSGRPSSAMTMPIISASILVARLMVTWKALVLIRYTPGFSIATWGPFIPPF
ncbi:MAG: hypothetical protein A4E30_01112 [Methanomassiliicoccales archaeon PtaB.Bin215]|nr:MAG: hypothetical protein A4E30_01112 [Methanomassiliicoccales archaeon PtaB.Bin215]